jgi:hypothetical protein
VLTSCPSCLQGLSRYNDDAGTEADYIVVEMVKRLLGDDWMAHYVAKANNGGIEWTVRSPGTGTFRRFRTLSTAKTWVKSCAASLRCASWSVVRTRDGMAID